MEIFYKFYISNWKWIHGGPITGLKATTNDNTSMKTYVGYY